MSSPTDALSSRGAHGGYFCLALVAALIAPVAFAQTPRPELDFDLDRLQLNPGATDSLVLGAGSLLPGSEARAALVADYQRDPLVLTLDSRQLGRIVHERATAHLVASYGVSRWLELGLNLPYIAWQQGDAVEATEVRPPVTQAMGSPRVQGRLGLLRQGDGGGMDLALTVGASLPLGPAGALTRQGSPGLAFYARVGAGRSFGILHLGLEAGASLREEVELSPGAVEGPIVVGNLLEGGVTLATRGEGLRAELNLLGALPLTQAPPGAELLAGVRYPLRQRLEVFALAGPGYGRLPGTPTFRVLSGLAWTPPSGR